MQSECNQVITEHGVVFDADLLFHVDVFQPLSACRVHSVENEGDLKLQEVIAVLETVHTHVSLYVTLLLPWHVFESFFVCLAGACSSSV
ncbi:hypothetical protein NPIL_369701 [Nephila pilipes]|uniref:Uncharacterized protein n=1 Tax=Nephila pilipes TaxID=299642 RepID=A0A8X6P772_NEPPI|nr:hypothetical protein NPIL_369701 [Nephila pilipes]